MVNPKIQKMSKHLLLLWIFGLKRVVLKPSRKLGIWIKIKYVLMESLIPDIVTAYLMMKIKFLDAGRS